MTTFSHLKTWDEIVSRAAEYRQERDEWSFELGDLTLFACGDATPGRPTDERKEHTVSALAFAIGEERSVMSNLMWNSYFWDPTERKKLPPNVSWRQCSEARRRSGWRPGMEITPKQREFAWTLVFKFADGDQVVPGKHASLDFPDLCRRWYTGIQAQFDAAPPGARPHLRKAIDELQEAEKQR
jgi:hypothetical protein